MTLIDSGDVFCDAPGCTNWTEHFSSETQWRETFGPNRHWCPEHAKLMEERKGAEITDDLFLRAVVVEAEAELGEIVAVEMTDGWYGIAWYCGEGTCEMEMVCVVVTLADGSQRFRNHEFAEWMRLTEWEGDPEGWEKASDHWCRMHADMKQETSDIHEAGVNG